MKKGAIPAAFLLWNAVGTTLIQMGISVLR